jgi:hypothetical protein
MRILEVKDLVDVSVPFDDGPTNSKPVWALNKPLHPFREKHQKFLALRGRAMFDAIE